MTSPTITPGEPYFCGANKGKRGFEPETKPWDNGTVNGSNAARRWSSDWTDSGYQTNLPKAYKDDLACGSSDACDTRIRSRTSTYPDFSIGSGNGRAIKYGKLYYSRFETNTGDSDEGRAIIRGSQVRKAKKKSAESVYCRIRSVNNGHLYLDRFCLFSEDKQCIRHQDIRTRRFLYRRIDWRTADRPNCYIGTDLGSGPP